MAVDLSNISNILKEFYADKLVDTVFKKNTLLSLIQKEQFSGSKYIQPLQYSLCNNRSSTFSTAVAGTQRSKFERFEVEAFANYNAVSIPTVEILASKGNEGAFIKALTQETTNVMRALSRDMQISLFGAGYGMIGKVASAGVSTVYVTLDDITTVSRFEVGQRLSGNSTATGSGTAHNHADNTIVAINRTTGVLELGSSHNIANSDYLFVYGDMGAGSSFTKMTGLDAWIPASAPGATSFWGIARNVDVERLGGRRFTQSSIPIEDFLIDSIASVEKFGNEMPDLGVLSHYQYAQLEKALSGKRIIDSDPVSEYTIGIPGIKFAGMKFIKDPYIARDTGFLLNLNSLKIVHYGDLVQFLDLDGNMMLRAATADEYQIRVGSYCNLVCSNPGANANLTFS